MGYISGEDVLEDDIFSSFDIHVVGKWIGNDKCRNISGNAIVYMMVGRNIQVEYVVSGMEIKYLF